MTDQGKNTLVGLGILGILAWLFSSSEENKTVDTTAEVVPDSSGGDDPDKQLSGIAGGRDVEAGGMTFTRINNDVNGNPRYVIHYLNLLKDGEFRGEIDKGYAAALKRAKKIGGRKFHNKQYGGGIVFQSYNLDSTAMQIKELLNEQPKKKPSGLGVSKRKSKKAEPQLLIVSSKNPLSNQLTRITGDSYNTIDFSEKPADPKKFSTHVGNKILTHRKTGKRFTFMTADEARKRNIISSDPTVVKSKAAQHVLRLMDNDVSYSEAVKKVLASNKKLNRKKLEKELNNYI